MNAFDEAPSAAPPSSPPPGFSVIVPTFNRPDQVASLLRSLSELDYPRDRFEVIIVDDGGDHDLEAVVAPFRLTLDVRCLRQSNAGPAAARNAGAAAARGEFIAFIDDDCRAHPNWLCRLAAAVRDDPAALVGGRSRNALARNPFACASQLIIDVVHRHFNHDARRAVFFPSENMAARRRRFQEIGMFDPTFRWSEDRDLCDRWAARGWPLVVAPDALVDHAHVMGLAGFVRQHFGYGRGAWRFHRARAERGSGRLKVEGGFYLRCFRQAFRDHPVHRAMLLATLLVLWQIANTAGFSYEAALSRLRGRTEEPAPSSAMGNRNEPAAKPVQ